MSSNKINQKLKKESNNYPSWYLSDRQICDLELLLNGAFSPLNGFMDKQDYESVLNNMTLSNKKLWPLPVTLDISFEFEKKCKDSNNITLRDKEGFPLAILKISDIWKPNLEQESMLVYGTDDINHPGVNYIKNIGNSIYVGGKLLKISLPHHYDYQIYRNTPSELKSIFKTKKWNRVVAFQTRNPLHRAHVEMTLKAIKDLQANLLLHPTIGTTKSGDLDYHTRVRCYEHVLKKYPDNLAIMSLLPLSMRMGGPKEALLHAIIRKNYGCTHFIVGRDHAGPGLNKENKPYYDPYAAKDLLLKYQSKIGIEMVPFNFMVYNRSKKSYQEIDKIKKNTKINKISGTELRVLLEKGEKIPTWFTYAEVAKELEKSKPPLYKRGLTVFFTGLSGSGKSTLANGLYSKFLEDGSRPVSLLDGDIVRTHLSSELGFSKKHRSINVKRIGFVASEITKNGGIAICAPIAPYDADRQFNRELISNLGGYIEIFVNTPLAKCEQRDVKGLYELARKGVIKEFTGITDPYEEPMNSELVIDSSITPPKKLVEQIFSKIVKMGYIKK